MPRTQRQILCDNLLWHYLFSRFLKPLSTIQDTTCVIPGLAFSTLFHITAMLQYHTKHQFLLTRPTYYCGEIGHHSNRNWTLSPQKRTGWTPPFIARKRSPWQDESLYEVWKNSLELFQSHHKHADCKEALNPLQVIFFKLEKANCLLGGDKNGVTEFVLEIYAFQDRRCTYFGTNQHLTHRSNMLI